MPDWKLLSMRRFVMASMILHLVPPSEVVTIQIDRICWYLLPDVWRTKDGIRRHWMLQIIFPILAPRDSLDKGYLICSNSLCEADLHQIAVNQAGCAPRMMASGNAHSHASIAMSDRTLVRIIAGVTTCGVVEVILDWTIVDPAILIQSTRGSGVGLLCVPVLSSRDLMPSSARLHDWSSATATGCNRSRDARRSAAPQYDRHRARPNGSGACCLGWVSMWRATRCDSHEPW